MIKVYIPSKAKTNIRGYWRNDKGRLYRDFIRQDIVSLYHQEKHLFAALERIKDTYSQECIFYEANNQGYIFYNKNKIETLKLNNAIIHFGYKGLKAKIKALIKQYGGLTVYVENGIYCLEVFYNVKG